MHRIPFFSTPASAPSLPFFLLEKCKVEENGIWSEKLYTSII